MGFFQKKFQIFSIRLFNLTIGFLDKIHMFLQNPKKFHSVLSFEANGLTLNYLFSSILSKLTPKFEACMNIYFWK